MVYTSYRPGKNDILISREAYADKLHGFWLGQCIANWTGLITEMDKIGGDGKNGRSAGFYTRKNWQGPDESNLWGSNNLSDTIDFLVEKEGGLWGADDDTDIEYIYQETMLQEKTGKLTGEQIREAWLRHIYSDDNTPFVFPKGGRENYLWVSNQTAHNLMRLRGLTPPATGQPENNPDYEMIDAQLTTEIFGFFAPGRPDIALDIAYLPVRTTAAENAALIAEFYVIMYALATTRKGNPPFKNHILEMAEIARKHLPNDGYPAKMYDFVRAKYLSGVPWEETRDALHEKYQVRMEDGYTWAQKDTVCHGCFAAGINFGASIISLLYGEGDFKETVKIAVLTGWDSDNPAATWGGLLGFMMGKAGIEKAFNQKFADSFNIHRTRGGFPNNGIDSFQKMAKKGIFVADRVIQEQMKGGIDLKKGIWYLPPPNNQVR
jgi:hypothetical protein